jgi:NADPH2 dehydrogenase
MELSHRVVLAPMTRYRSTDAHVPGHLVTEYYTQRASTPGTLLVTEGVLIDPRAGGYANVPGLSLIVHASRWSVNDYVSLHG